MVVVATASRTAHRRIMLAAVVLLVMLQHAVHGNPDAKRLYDDLLSNYNRLIRPVANNTDKITVKMGLKLSQLVDLVSIVTIVCLFFFVLGFLFNVCFN